LCGAPIRGAASWSWVSCGGRPIRPVPASGRPCWRRRRRPTWTGWARRRGPARAPTSQEAHAAAKEAVAALRAGRLPGPGLLAAAGIARALLAAAPAAPVLPQAAGAPYPPKPRVGGVGRGPGGV
jgi:hypothetical protein